MGSDFLSAITTALYFTGLVGGDMHMTINWTTADEIIEQDLPIENTIDVETPQNAIDEMTEYINDMSEDG